MVTRRIIVLRLIIVLLVLCCAGVSAQQGKYTMTVQTDEGPQLFYVDEIDYIDFTANQMVIHPKTGSAQQFAQSTMYGAEFATDSHEAVDLGLSVHWATCNMGADSPEDYGLFYAWGETLTKYSFTEANYKYYTDQQYQYIGTNICGTTYDVAHRQWGGHWRMPTRSEVRELTTQCTWQPDTLNQVPGYRVTGPNGKSIFLPSTGYQTGTKKEEVGTCGYYWTGSLNRQMPYSAYTLNFRGYDDDWSANRFLGFAIRPVR